MSNIGNGKAPGNAEQNTGDGTFVLPLETFDRSQLSLETGGGKAANLGELIRAGFSVPGGFVVTTASYTLISHQAGLDPILEKMIIDPGQAAKQLEKLAGTARETLLNAPVPAKIGAAITEAYRNLGNGAPIPVAVRSSATTEDLPYASFAGQQETYLNVAGIEDLLIAIQRCWASLWNERAVTYRASLGLSPKEVRLAVVVQPMIFARTAGVLFTANPLTGKRHQTLIEANPGLGEAIVSGMTNPDNFLVNTTTGEVVERRLGARQTMVQPLPGGGTHRVGVEEPQTMDREACLTKAQVQALAQLGGQVETHFKMPQDIEWAIDASGLLWLLQARPITTLFPLPAEGGASAEGLRVYLSYNLQQGTYRPFTPMGISATRFLAAGLLRYSGFPLENPLAGPAFLTQAGARLFIDVTPALRNFLGRRILSQVMAQAEVHAASIFRQLAANPQLSLLSTSKPRLTGSFLQLLLRTRLPWYVLKALISPGKATERLQLYMDTLRATAGKAEGNLGPNERLASVERLLLEAAPGLVSKASPLMLGGMLTFNLAAKLLGSLATEAELHSVLRGAPSNPTTEMSLALWELAGEIKGNPLSAAMLLGTPARQLGEDYRQGTLPPLLQRGLAKFLAIYGHRSVSELDLGQPRWSEDPTYLFGLLANYLQSTPTVLTSGRSEVEESEATLTPPEQFHRAAEEATGIISTLSGRAKSKGRVRGWLAAFCLKRAHALGGLREMPRFCLSLLLAQGRRLLWPVGEELVRAGRLAQAEDIFYLTLPEIHAALAGSNFCSLVQPRRALYQEELLRRHVPLVLLSDGTEPAPAAGQTLTASASGKGLLQGTPASPGVVTGPARVILEPDGARLAPGEILVAPSTDPAWTPLFLTAGGLVMEMGGAMAHGAIVAREYGIAAVVAVPGATSLIKTGQLVTIDGSRGTVTLLD